MEIVYKFLPSALTLVTVVVTLIVVRRLLDRSEAKLSGHQFRHQVIMILLTAVGLLIIILVFPMGDTMRGQVLSLIGILLSAAIALSSTTILGNGMAGVMLRAVGNFRAGDFVRTGEHFGRVSEQGLFHTEIQTEDRELTTLPNLYLVTHPVTTVRTSGTILSTTVSLGYDVPRKRVKELLVAAASNAKLDEPFVHVTELGDFSVTYRVAGLLTEIKQLLSARSRLRESVLDSLHDGGVEIVSPTFMNTRAFSPDDSFVPTATSRPADDETESSPEDIVFDKAEQAETVEQLRDMYSGLKEDIEALKKRIKQDPEGTEREAAEQELAELEARKEQLEEFIADRTPEAKATE